MDITPSMLKKVERSAKKLSNRTGVPSDELYSEALSKIPNIINNFSERAQTSFEAYLVVSCKYYMLNFIRDKSFLSSIGRTKIAIYNKSQKFPNLRVASNCLRIPLEELKQLHHQVKMLRRYNQTNADDEWKLTDEVFNTTSISSSVTLSAFLTQDEIDKAIDVILNGAPADAEYVSILTKILDHHDICIDSLR